MGAADYRQTPRYGQTPALPESFSSRGGTPILRDANGNSVAAITRNKPDIVAPDGVDTTFFSTDSDGTTFPNFYGTSAAAPHAAAVGALLLQAKPGQTPNQIYNAMRNTASDMSTPGFDYYTGYGLLNAEAALASVTPPPASDLSITKTDGVTSVHRGDSVEYTITVSNAGPAAVVGAIVKDTLGSDFSGVSFTGAGTGGGTGAASGTGSINDTVNLPVGATFTYTVKATVATTAGSSLVNTATVTAPTGTTDPTSGNNSATDTDTVVNSAPSVSDVTIDQSAPKTNDTLSFTGGDVSDKDGDKVSKLYEWMKQSFDNKRVLIPGQTGPTLDLSVLGHGDKGEKISVIVTANDGTTTTSTESPQVTIVNSAPVINSVTIANSAPKTNDTLSVIIDATDADGDSFLSKKGYDYYKAHSDLKAIIPGENGETLDLSKAGNGDKDDKISVVVTLTDGTDSTSSESPQVTIINSVPVIDSVTITPTTPLTDSVLKANVAATDADDDTLTYGYEWRKNGELMAADYNYKETLDLSKPGVGDNGDTFTVTVTATDSSKGISASVTSAPVTVGNIAPVVESVAPQGAIDKVGDKRTFTVTVSDGNGPTDIKEMWLLINTRLTWSEGATLIYVPSASSPTDGLLYLRQGDSFLPPITIGTGATAGATLDNGAIRVLGSDVNVTVSGNAIILTISATIRDGLIGENTMFARVQDAIGNTDPAALAGEMGFVRSGFYTVTQQFGGQNLAPTLSRLTPTTGNSVLNGGITPAQNFGFFVKDENGIGDIDNVVFLAGKQRGWTNTATVLYEVRTRRLYLRSDDGRSWLGGGRVGAPGILENSQVRLDLSKAKVTIIDSKSFGLTLPLQGKTPLLGQNQIWLRVQDKQGLTSPDGDAQGYVHHGGWNLATAKPKDAPPKQSNGTS
ncbi:DUF11 domain-containing protein [bacterium]|nr:MAG: DUF11 domain-containing protein [bacterium]